MTTAASSSPASVSVIVPSHARPAKLAACVAGLAGNGLIAGRDEVLVGLDGPEPDAVEAALAAWRTAGGDAELLTVVECPRAGANEVRSAMLERARGDLVVLLNDDVRPQAGFIDAHRRRHGAGPAIVVGHSPYVTPEHETLLDRLVARTGLVFPWPALLEAPDRPDHGYRAAVTLNLSVGREHLLEVGGFAPSNGWYGHDDLELGFRLQRACGLPVRFAPEARAAHDHRHEADELLRRDALLGASLWHYAQRSPAFACDLVGHDVHDPRVRAYYAEFVRTERRDAAAGAERWRRLAGRRADAITDDDEVLEALARQHLPTRRVLWRSGLLAASEGRFDAARALEPLTVQRIIEPGGSPSVRPMAATGARPSSPASESPSSPGPSAA